MYRETVQSEKLYSRVARRYDEVFERAMLSEARLTQLARQTMDDRRVLDLACGNGRWLDRFSPESYVGLDLNARMLDEARRRHPRATFLRGDMTALPFPDASFDGVMSMFGAMGHLPPDGQRRMVDEIHRVLAPDGMAILTNGNMWSPFNLPTTLLGNRVRLEGVRFRVFSSNPSRLALLVDRFRVLRLESYDYSYIPILPLKFLSCLLGHDYRSGYERLMEILGFCRYIPRLRWFGKQLVAVCQKA
ncbi:MAG: class I SAM-dependent methyltransferase [Candidatus Sumerlaeota bacterium]|nr:class I SAM-dependent methyltransferase [Candidatus Sumerlaeota bacterium]